MASKNQLISDVILRVTKSKPSDDLELEPSQIAFWLSNIANSVIKDYLDAKLKKGESIDSFFIRKESCKFIETEDDGCTNCSESKMYITLSNPAMDLYGDSAIIRLRTSSGEKINKAQLDTIDYVEDLEFAKSSEDNLIYYSEAEQNLIILGIPMSMKSDIEISVWYVPKFDLNCMEDNEDVKIPSELLPIILEEAEILAIRELSGTQDIENNAKDESGQQING